MSGDALARALGAAEVGCWANPPVHGPDRDEEIHVRDARALIERLADDGLVIARAATPAERPTDIQRYTLETDDLGPSMEPDPEGRWVLWDDVAPAEPEPDLRARRAQLWHHNHDEDGTPTYPLYRDRCAVGCDDLTPHAMRDVGDGPIKTRRLMPTGPSRFALIDRCTQPDRPCQCAARTPAEPEPNLLEAEYHRGWEAANRLCAEGMDATPKRPAGLDVERLHQAMRQTEVEVLRQGVYVGRDADLSDYAEAIAVEYARLSETP